MHPKWRHTFWNGKGLHGSWQLKYTEELFTNKLRGLAFLFFHFTWTEVDWRGISSAIPSPLFFYERSFTRTFVTHRGNVARKPFWAEGAVGDGSGSNQPLRQSSQEVPSKISSWKEVCLPTSRTSGRAAGAAYLRKQMAAWSAVRTSVPC